MSVSRSDTGTQGTTANTEHTLATITTAGVYQLHVDANNMVDGKTLILRAYEKTLSSSTERLAYEFVFFNAQRPADIVLPPMACVDDLKFTLEYDASSVNFDWAVFKIA